MIEVENLGRSYGPIQAVAGISFHVKQGDVLGFLGPNGAGKSTTMKMLTCFITPSFGTATVCGYDILKSPVQVRASLGYLPENAPLYGEMDVRSMLRFVAEVRGLKGPKMTTAIDRVVQQTSLGGVLGQRIETLSKGFKRRVALAQALVHDPKVLILDEPTDGLDPNQKHEVRELIRSMSTEKCIILSTHILEEVDEVCNRAIVIAHGKIVADEKPEDLRRRSPLHGAISFRPTGAAVRAVDRVRVLDGVREVRLEKGTDGREYLNVLVHDRASALSGIARVAAEEGWALDDLRVDVGQLDDVFRTITTHGA